MLHICGKSNFNIPDVECDGSLHFEGVTDTTINQGVGIDLAEGISAYDSDGNEVEFTYKPEEIEKCDVGEHTVIYEAQGKNAGDMIPTVCGRDRLHMINCDIDTVKATRIITITQAGDPVIQGIDPTLLPSGSTVDLLSGVTATDDNGNPLEVAWYGEKDSLAEGDIATFETDLAPNLLKKAEVRLDPVQDLHGYDKPWVGGAGKNLLDLTNATLAYCVLTDADTGSVRLNVTNGYYANISQTASQVDPKIIDAILNGNPITLEAENVGAKLVTIIIFGTRSDSSTAQELSGSGGKVTLTPTLWNSVTSVVFRVARSGSSYTDTTTIISNIRVSVGSTATAWSPYTNICPIYGHDDVEVWHTGKNLWGGERLADDIVSADSHAVKNTVNKTIKFSASDITGRVIVDGIFKENTRYTLICKDGGTSNAVNIKWQYSDGTYSWMNVFTDGLAVSTSIEGRTVVSLSGGWSSGNTDLKYEECGLFEGVVTADDFEAYTEQTYNQDIEVTYTPTSTNNIPYNFKAVGDIYGDRLSESIVGGTVAWNQLAPNELQGYANEHINKTVSGDEITVTSNTDTAYLKGVTRGASSGRVYLASTYLKSDGTTGVSLGFRKNGVFINIVPGGTAWQTNTAYMQYQVMAKVTESGVAFGIFLKNDTLTNGYGVFKNVQLFDLTAMFGSTIADYIYSLEQANAGDGVAFFRKLFPNSYYPYDSGSLKSVTATSHDTVGFNQWDEEYIGGYYSNTGALVSRTDQLCTKNKIEVTPNTTYYFKLGSLSGNQGHAVVFYDANNDFIDRTLNAYSFTTPSNCKYINANFGTNYGTTYNNDICINISSDKNGTYEPYFKHSYPLDDSLTLRGKLQLADGNLYYDGDIYKSIGEVTRRYGFRAYQSGDESLTDAITDGTNTVYKLTTPTTESALPFADPQRVSKYGTEAYEGSEIPVGHNTTYLTRDIYGGTLDLVSGVLTVTHKMVDLGTLTYSYITATGGYFNAPISDIVLANFMVTHCSCYHVVTSGGIASMPDASIRSYNDGNIIIKDSRFTDPNDIKTAINGQTAVYYLATPQTYQLNRHQIETLVGKNNMWDDGYMKVVYTETIQDNPVTFDVDGTYRITYEAEDECGNETRQTRLIFIRNENVYFLGLDHFTNTLGESFDLTENVHAYDGQGNELEFTVTPEYNAFALGNRTYTYTADGYSEGRVITIVPPTTPIQTEDDEDIETEDGVVLETDALTPIPLTYENSKWMATIPINPLHTYTFRLEGLKAFAYIRVNVTGEGGDVATYDGIGTTDWNLTWTPSEHVESGQSWENARQALIEISQTDEPTAYVIVQ